MLILSLTLSCRIADDGDIRITLVSDIHYAEKPNAGNRHYTQSLEKARQAIATFNENETDFMVLLGDNIDEVDKESDLTNLKILDEELSRFNGERIRKYKQLNNACEIDLQVNKNEGSIGIEIINMSYLLSINN